MVLLGRELLRNPSWARHAARELERGGPGAGPVPPLGLIPTGAQPALGHRAWAARPGTPPSPSPTAHRPPTAPTQPGPAADEGPGPGRLLCRSGRRRGAGPRSAACRSGEPGRPPTGPTHADRPPARRFSPDGSPPAVAAEQQGACPTCGGRLWAGDTELVGALFRREAETARAIVVAAHAPSLALLEHLTEAPSVEPGARCCRSVGPGPLLLVSRARTGPHRSTQPGVGPGRSAGRFRPRPVTPPSSCPSRAAPPPGPGHAPRTRRRAAVSSVSSAAGGRRSVPVGAGSLSRRGPARSRPRRRPRRPGRAGCSRTRG